MQKLAEICIRRPVFASMLILALVVVGAAAYFRLGVDRLPSVDLPTVLVWTDLPGGNTETVETEVSERIEDAVNTVEGISELRSISGMGRSLVIVTFNLNRNIDVATQDIRDRIATLQRDLNIVGADPPIVYKNNNDDAPVLTIAMSGQRSLRELREIADKFVKPQLERSSGVGEVRIIGGLARAINVWVDANKLAAYHLPVTAVRDAVVRQNADIPGGNVTGPQREAQLRTPARLADARAFEDLVIGKVNGYPIRVRDIGRAEDSTKEKRSSATLNGVPNVTLEIRRQSGTNTIEVIEDVKRSLAKARHIVPGDVKLEVIRDQSRYIHAALHEINLHLVLGSMLACLVVLAFMRNWRATLIAGIAIPTSVVSTFGMMWALKFTLNSVTMLALVLMVGIVIDDAIVVLENIFRFVEEKKMTPLRAAAEATREIGLAVLATTLSLVVIFIPVSFMSSVSGRFLYQFGITAAVSVMVSLLVSFTLTPMMSARLMRPQDAAHDAHSRQGFYGLLDAAYIWLLRLAMRWRYAVALLAVAIVAASGPLYGMVKKEFVPTDVDEAEFMINLIAPENTSLPAMEEAVDAMAADVQKIRGVRVVLATAGGGFLGQVNYGGMYVRIAPHEERVFSLGRLWKATLAGDPGAAFRGNYAQRDVMIAVRKTLAKYPAVRSMVRNFPSFNTGGSSFDVDFVLTGPDLATLARYGDQIRNLTRRGPRGEPPAIPGLVDIDTTLRLDKPELQLEIDRNRAADLDIAAQDIGSAVKLLVGGDDRVSRYRDDKIGELYDVQVRLEEKDRLHGGQLSTLYLPRKNGQLVELSNIASLKPVDSPSRIDRLDRQRMVAVRGGVAPGYAQADRIEALRKAAAELNLPPLYNTTVAGRAREFERTFMEFLWAFALSVVFMYIILAMNYESLVHPFTILLSLPLSIPFALLSLWYTGNTLNLFSALGILVLFGVVKKNAILQIDHMNQLRARGLDRLEAILQGNRDRLRPILMTTLALVAGMLPLWLGTGPGAEERRAVAVVVIGGQTLCLLLTLLVTPVAYSLLDDLAGLLGKLRGTQVRRVREETMEMVGK